MERREDDDRGRKCFFREAPCACCSSLDIETALKRCFEYIGLFHPRNSNGPEHMDPDLMSCNYGLVVLTCHEILKISWHYPEGPGMKGQSFEKAEEMVKIINPPRPEARTPRDRRKTWL